MKNLMLFCMSAMILGGIFVLDAKVAPVLDTPQIQRPSIKKAPKKIRTRMWSIQRAVA